MAQATHRRAHLTLNTDGRRHPLENALTGATLVLGLVAFACAFFGPAHAVAFWSGLAGVAAGVTAQYLSATTAERWLIIVGWGASAIGLAAGLARGGPW